ncbi:MAG TPA: anti-sigma factor antagonist [Syntrophobacteraceae bacterium]|nr:anti-sigma factor antagonist [Syntrophobacteraceae bacterium]
MELNCEKMDNAMVVTVKGRLDTVTAPDFERQCSAWIDQGEISLLVDLNQLDYVSSAGLRTILVVSKKLKHKGGRMCFCGARDMVLRVLSLANFTSLFPVYDSFEEALTQWCR